MPPLAEKSRWFELEEFVDAFETAQVRHGQANLADFLPPAEHPNRRDVALELVRVDLEYRWRRGDLCSPDSYRARLPDLFDDLDAVQQIEFEVERLSRRRFNECLYPEVGDDFMGFHIVGELGRGAFAKVYLAEQEGLANRRVALKVSKILFGESQTLAQLQHTNIVPIYSVHVEGPFQAVCMPYFGGTTLADVLRDLRGRTDPPDSGLDLVSTVRSGPTIERHLTSIIERSTPLGSHAAAHSREGFPATMVEQDIRNGIDRSVPWVRLAGLSYIEAVLWITARLAEALDHAHSRGIMHCDLKPANILLADEGQPMLLDFNLSVDAANEQSARVGGTLPYMSPEQIEALDGHPVTVDVRSDIYSLGAVVYEMLALRPPFAVPAGGKEPLAALQANRSAGPPALAAPNPAVTPAVESIIRHALEADPECRYRTARELAEDIERHLSHRPLRYAPEPSWRERASKWVRRHPRATSHVTVALFGVACLALVVAGSLAVERRHAKLNAVDEFRRLEKTLPAVLYRLNGALSNDGQRPVETVEQAHKLLSQYHVDSDEHWYNGPDVVNLDDGLKHALRERLGGLCLSLAAAAVDANADSDQVQRALEWNRLADRCFSTDRRPRVLWTQRAELLRRLGQVDEAEAVSESARAAPSQKAVDYYWGAFERAQRHEYQAAISSLEMATEEDPQLFWAWFQLGRCHDGLSHYAQAAQCYTVCLALLPDSGEAYYHRGLARLRDGLYAPALADFDQVLQFLPNLASVYLDRGEARLGLNDANGAADEFTEALESGADKARALAGRSKAHSLSGNHDAARADVAAALAAQPKGEDGWVARGMARLPADPAGALADYAEALKLAPWYLPALQNSAVVLGELPGRGDEAIAMLDRALETCPDFVPARIGRAVLLARAGRRDAALADARESLLHDQQPVTLYQAACVYVLVSPGHADDRHEALRLLSAALAGGFGREFIAVDHDLDALRSDDEFRCLAAKATAQ
jgi:serine/threonine protein kinase/tetratricopeptide (TPR) repeat protein